MALHRANETALATDVKINIVNQAEIASGKLIGLQERQGQDGRFLHDLSPAPVRLHLSSEVVLFPQLPSAHFAFPHRESGAGGVGDDAEPAMIAHLHHVLYDGRAEFARFVG